MYSFLIIGGYFMLDEYYTVNPFGSEEVIVQKSRFIGYIKRAETKEEAQAFINEIKKRHHDATHNCSAYLIGEHDEIQKANDDGEPIGTAGFPILEVLKKQQLKDTVVVVTRYFGGIKLGAGGLIRAYGTTTSKAIKNAGVVKRQLMQGFSIIIEYSLLGILENGLRNSKHIIGTINYLEKVELIVYVHINEVNHFLEWITNLTSNQAIIEEKRQKYVEIAF